MREYFTYGSVRGAAGNGGPYRDPLTSRKISFCTLAGRTRRTARKMSSGGWNAGSADASTFG